MLYLGKDYIFNDSRPNRAKLNAVGQDIVGYIRAHGVNCSFDQLVSHLLESYEVDRKTLERDAVAFVEDAIATDILVNVELLKRSEQVINNIHEFQAEIPQLSVYNFEYCAVLGREELSPGCSSCQRGRWAVMLVCPKCNLSCYPCPYTRTSADGKLAHICSGHCGAPTDCDSCEIVNFRGITFTTLRELQLQFDLVKQEYDSFAWIGGEPMLPEVMRKMLPMIRYFREAYPSYHQWVYTNGTHASADNMNALSDAGIREIRFNLAATSFDKTVVAAMKKASSIFEWVCLEIPMNGTTHAQLLENITAVLDTGLHQMNLGEWLVGTNHFGDPNRLRAEGELYSYRGYMTSPVTSRQYVYDIIKRAAAESWPVVINDCSNEYKHYKLSVQQKHTSIFQGHRGYWNNTHRVSDVERWNDGESPDDDEAQ